jgi:hypothetical protein
VDDHTIAGEDHDQFVKDVRRKAVARIVAELAHSSVPVSASQRDLLKLGAAAAAVVIFQKLNDAGVLYTDQARGLASDATPSREAVRALFTGPNACGIWLENLLADREADQITDTVMALLEAPRRG